MNEDSQRPNALKKLFECKGWNVQNTLKEIDTYFYSLEANFNELHKFIINNQNHEAYEDRELDKEFFRLLSNFCSAIMSYYYQTKHWFDKEQPVIECCREFDFIKAIRDTIVHNTIPPTETTCHYTTKGVFVTRTIKKEIYIAYLDNYLKSKNDIKWHIRNSFENTIEVLKKYNENEIDIANECGKCYNRLKEFNDDLKKRYKTENAMELEELNNIWNEIFKET